MKHFIDFVESEQGGPLQGVVVTVVDPTSGSVIPIYSDNSGTPIVGNTVTTDTQGDLDFYIANGTYNVEYRYGGALLKVLKNVDMYDGNVTAAAQTLQGQAAASAASAAASALTATQAGIVVQASLNGLFASTANALSSGVINTATLVGGTGGTNGTFAVAFSGGAGSGAAATFVVAGGAVTQITITSKGVGYTSAPTMSFAASTGLSGASATAVIAPRTNSGDYFLVIGTGNTYAEVYKNVSGVATDQNIAVPSLASVLSVAALNTTITAASSDVTDADHAISILDADGRIDLAFGGDGRPVDSSLFMAEIGVQNAINNTPGAIARLPLLGLPFQSRDWWGVTIAGQSNAVGNSGSVITTVQPFSNKKLSGGALIPLVESGNETVASGTTAHAKDALLRVLPLWATFNQDWIATNMGASATALSGISQGTTPYNAGKAAVTTIQSLAVSAGKTYAERAMLFQHGETDSNISTSQATYLSGMIALKNNWNTDILAITGQTDRIPMFVAQVAFSDTFDTTLGPTLAMLQAAETDSEVFIIAPGYAFRFINDGLHYKAHDERWIGEYFGKALHRYYIEKRNPGTVRPLTWTRIDATTIDVAFYVPVPPLVFDLDRVWPPDAGLGFAVYDAGGTEVPIQGVRITGPTTVRITTTTSVAAGYSISYATKIYVRSGTGGLGSGNHRGPRGNLRDSDQTASYYNDAFGNPYPLHNWCAIFKKTLA